MVYLKVKENSEKVRVPNTASRKAIDDARKGKMTKAKNVSELMKKLKS